MGGINSLNLLVVFFTCCMSLTIAELCYSCIILGEYCHLYVRLFINALFLELLSTLVDL